MRTLRGNPWAVLVTLSLGFFMTLLDLTIVNIAIPSMIDKLGASLDEVLWVVNAYVLVLAVLLITAGRLGDLRGQRTMFALGVAVFTLASLACGLSGTPAELIAARAVQGLGAAILMPQTMAIIVATFPAERRGAALGIWGAVAGLATVTGPTLGGLLVTTADWRWIFFVNVPVGAVVLALSFAFLPGTRMARPHRLDWTGVLIASAALFCLVFALIEGQRFGWDARIWALAAGFVLLTGLFLAQQRARQDREPLVPFGLFTDRNFTIMIAVAAAVSTGIVGFFLPFTIYLQSVLGFSALKAGLVLAPASALSMVLSPLAGRMSDRFGGKYILLGGLICFAVGAALMVVAAGVDTGWTAFLPGQLILGVGFGALFAPLATEAMRGVAPRMAGAAAGVNNTFRQVGSVVGSAAVGALLQHELAGRLASEAVTRAGALPAAARPGFVAGFAGAGSGGLRVGAGQTGAAQNLPAGLPAQVVAQIRRVAAEVFQHAFVAAMRPTMVLPIGVIVVAMVLCAFARRRTSTVVGPVLGAPPEKVQAA